jgi:ribulose-5-phosphate 4-epimerase/fuculose-1-phosphate aldolase
MATKLKPDAGGPATDAVEALDERALRIELAASYRLVALYGMDDTVFTHITARVPGDSHHFLINPLGLLWEEITASALVRIDLDGNVIDPPGAVVNYPGFVIHSAVHAARRDVVCVMHTHTVAGIAVAATKAGLLPISQHAMEFYNRLGVHDYEGIATDLDERARLVRDLGPHSAMLLRNHGLLTCGASVAEAFHVMYYLEQACRAQVAAASMGELRLVPPPVAEHAARQFLPPGSAGKGRTMWRALLRKLDRLDPSYRN